MAALVETVPELRGFESHLRAPADLPDLVGRDAEFATARDALDRADPSPVNICGLAGSGKSRLALALAGWAATRFDDGYVVVDLERTRCERQALAATCAALDLTSRDLDGLATTLSSADLLLVLDHADDVRDFAAMLQQAMADADGVRLVVCTSRPMRLRGVVSIRLSGLSVPSATTLDDVRASPAATAFVNAVEGSDPAFALDASTSAPVATICEAVGGLPLALELTAARASGLGVAAVAELLGSTPALDLLGSHGRSAGGHTEGLRGALQVTFDLLSESERATLRRLSVLHDPFSLDTALALTASESSQTIDDLTNLGDLRLVEPVPGSEGCSYRLVPLARELAREQLRRSGEEPASRAAHAQHFAALARRAAAAADEAGESTTSAMPARCVHDLDAAASWLVEHGTATEALRAATDLLVISPHPGGANGLRRIDRLLADPRFDGAAVDVRADALLAAAALGLRSFAASDVLELARRRWSAGLDLARRADDPLRVLRGLRVFALAVPVHGDFDTTGALLEEGLELSARIGHGRWLARFEAWSGMLRHQQRRFDEAASFGERALSRALRTDDRVALINAGMLLHTLPPEHRPDVPLLPDLERLLDFAVELDDGYLQMMVLGILAGAALGVGDCEGAAHWVARRLDLVSRSGEWRGAGISLITAVLLAAATGQLASAARWHGAVTPMLDVLMAGMAPQHQELYDGVVGAVRQQLGDEGFESAALAGSLLSWQDAVAETLPFARAASRSAAPQVVPDEEEPPLTPREMQVLHLLAEGLSNKQIGRRLGVSPKTAMHHSGAIYRKLGVRSRAQAAAVAIRRGMVTHD